ncbi:MAG: extracellular solute-binding protein [Clostridia bacterium]
MRKYMRMLTMLLMLTLACVVLFSCTHAPAAPPAATDVLTQKPIPQGRTPVTVLVKYAFSINGFEKAVEEHFPTIDLIQVGNFTSNSGLLEFEARMEHDDLPDLVMTWPLECGEQYCDERLLDLSAMPFTSYYNIGKLNRMTRGGKLYYLPGPSQIRGIVYNQTLFAEKGWQVPADFEGFLSLCQQIEADGMRSLQLGLANPEVLDTAFVGYGYASCFASPKDAQWLDDYNQGKGSFADQFQPALATFQALIDAGILKPEDLTIDYARRERMLFNRECAMVEDSVLIARMGNQITGSTDSFALMPFFNPGQDGDWARLYPVCYIGLNKHLAEPANQEKYDLALQLMDYISTQEGQLALSCDTGGMYSSLAGMPPPNVPEIEPLLSALMHGRCARFPTLQNAQTALRQGLAGMVRGELTAEQVCQRVDAQNLAPTVTPPPAVLGSAKADFTLLETGNFLTDAMRAQSGCEIALFLDNGKDGLCSGKGLCSTLYQGDITTADIQRLMPDLKRGERLMLQKGTMTGENLIRTLEYALPVDHNQAGWFYYFSGLRMEFAPAAQPGQRIHSITDEQGQAIDPARLYSIAIMDTTVPQEYLQTCEDTGILIDELLTHAIQSNQPISPDKEGRFVICQP